MPKLIQLTGRLGTVQVQPAKTTGDNGQGQTQGGALVLPLILDRPKQPFPPGMPWQLKREAPENPGDPGPKGSKEAKAAWKSYQDTMGERGQLEKDYADMVAKYEAAVRVYTPDLVMYAQIAGLSAVMGNLRVRIIIEPLDQDFLPGFLPALLGDGAAPAAAAQAEASNA